MTLSELIKKLAKAKIKLSVENGFLSASGPRGAVTQDILKELKVHKEALLRYLDHSSVSEEPAIKPVGREQNLPLSYSQKRLWLLDQIEEGSAHYNIPSVLKLVGKLRIDVINKVFTTIANRHEVLRTCFSTDKNGEPIQVIQSLKELNIEIQDYSALHGEPQQIRIKEVINSEASQTFDLSQGLMFRVKIIKTAAEEHYLLVTMHHIASDGWSEGILIKEFSMLYSAYMSGQDNPLPSLAIQYADYANWQQNWLTGEILDKQLNYWQRTLKGIPAVHNLPLDRSRSQLQNFTGSTHHSTVAQGISEEFNRFCLSMGATLFMGLHAVFSSLLSIYSNEQDIVIGTPVANREQPELADLIGFFVNTLVLRSDLSGNPSFIQLLAQSKSILLDAYAHQQAPFEKVVEKLQPERSLSYSPLFQVMLVLQNNETEDMALSGLQLHAVEQAEAIAKYELSLNVIETAEGLSLLWQYSSALFDRQSIERMAGHFNQLISALLANPEKSVLTTSILDENDQIKLIDSWNDTTLAYPQNICLHSQFEAQVAATPDAVAAMYENAVVTEQQLTYGELNTKANQLAHYLITEKQVQPDTLVG
ncbi:condensation domain-containing protein, partial [Rheinheimera gaetbuli]